MTPTRDAGNARAVGRWLAAWAVLVFAIILVGGATRLTESGLSITEWKPVRGVVPPLSHAEWTAEFAKYRRIPQYQRLNAGMSLDAFKGIYLWEFWHRIVARLAGLAYVLPLVWFAARRRIPPLVRGRVYLLLGLLLAQAAMGWWMVTSGLSVRTEVSQYRLAAHLLTALVILGISVWTAADLLDGPRRATSGVDTRRSRALGALLGLVFVTAGSGALVAGLRAGRVFNTFPLMGGRVVPPGYGQLAPWGRNVFENHAAVQFHHRVLAVATFLAAVTAWTMLRGSANRPLARRVRLVLAAALLQLALGIATLLLAVPTALGVAHQAGAALLLTAVLLAWHANGAPVPPVAGSPRG
ncbi:MAG: COX15/CtaA family protein [Gemmatirosa sp.]